MKPTGVRAIAVLAFAMLNTAFATSCAAPPSTTAEPPPSIESGSPSPGSRLAQLDFGRRAMFALCLPPACPGVTTKTLAADVPSTESTPRSTEPSKTLDRRGQRPVEGVSGRSSEGP